MTKVITAICASIVLVSCGTSSNGSRSSLPKPVETEHIVTDGAGFLMNGKVRYSCSYKFKNLTTGTYMAVIQFENPTNPSHPYVAYKKIHLPSGPVLIESQELDSITSKRNYQVKLVLHRGSASGPVVDTHTQYVNFPITPRMASMFGISTQIN